MGSDSQGEQLKHTQAASEYTHAALPLYLTLYLYAYAHYQVTIKYSFLPLCKFINMFTEHSRSSLSYLPYSHASMHSKAFAHLLNIVV